MCMLEGEKSSLLECAKDIGTGSQDLNRHRDWSIKMRASEGKEYTTTIKSWSIPFMGAMCEATAKQNYCMSLLSNKNLQQSG